MRGQPISRRAALARIGKLGSVTLAAAVLGCDIDDSSTSPSPAPARTAEATSAPALTAVPSRTPAAPTPPPEVRLDIVPTALAIPTLAIHAPIAPALGVRGSGGLYEIAVPESGIVSPNRLIGDKSVNNVWILGHSRWHRVPQLLYTLPGLNRGDPIAVAGYDQAGGRDLPNLTFEVDRLVLADTDTTAAALYGDTPRLPRLIIQTSARQAYDPEWILDRTTLESKADIDLAGDIEDLSRYLLLLVIARLREDSLASLLATA